MATATVGTNRITRTITPGKSLFPDAYNVIPNTLSFNQGDLLVWDTNNNVIKAPSAESDGQYFLGIAVETIVNGKLKRPYSTAIDASFGADTIAGPQYDCVAQLILKAGSSLTPGQSVYLDPSDSPAGVQPTGTKPIGIYQGPSISGSSAGQLVEVLLGCRYPNDTLKF